MRTWTVILLAVLALLLGACGTSEEGTNGGNSEGENEGKMTATLEKSDNGYRYTLKNDTDEAMTFNFTSSQRFDFALYNEEDEQVFLQSSVSSYAQVLGEETMEAGGELSYELEVPPLDLEPGTYKIEAWFTPQQGAAYPAENEYVKE
jgi:hypothetical protein